MTTDNKTLADECNCPNGRAEHMPTCASLRATLADVQPGGRVRLGDQAERARFEAFLSRNPLMALCAGTAWQVWQAALSAQPSQVAYHGDVDLKWLSGSIGEVAHRLSTYMPTGLAEWADRARDCRIAAKVLSELSAQPSPVHQIDAETLWWLQDAINTMAEGGNQSHVRFLQSLHDSLAAQPSPGGQDASFPWENFPAYLIDKCEGDTISEEGLQQALASMAKDQRYCLAARQPVGEPVAWMTHHDEPMLFPTAGEAAAYCEDDEQPVPLFRSPAQAVDLGDFKALYRAYVRLLESGRDRIRDLGGACDPVDVMEANDVDLQAARRVLDSQAVGNG